MKKRTAILPVLFTVCLILFYTIPASAASGYETAEAASVDECPQETAEIAEAAEAEETEDPAAIHESELSASADRMETVPIEAPAGYRNCLTVLNAGFESADGHPLRALIGSLTQQNQSAVLSALSLYYTDLSGHPLKLIHEDFIDVEKWNSMPDDPFDEGLRDDALCWAASVSGTLWSSGWAQRLTNPATGETYRSEDEFFTWYADHFANIGGEADRGLDWFFDGTYLPSGTGRNPWFGSDMNEGSYPDLMAECLYEKTLLVDDPEALGVMNRLSGDAVAPAFEASIGFLDDGAVSRSSHSVTAPGLITDPAAAETASRYRAILLADPDNDGSPTIPVEGSTDEQRIADRSARPNSYTVYPLRLITDVNGKKCWQILGYGSDPEETVILYELLCLTAYSEDAAKDAAETEGSRNVYQDPDFLISGGITSDSPPESELSADKPVVCFRSGDDIYFIFSLLNKGVSFNPEGKTEDVSIRLVLSRNASESVEELRSLRVDLYGPVFYKKYLKLNETTVLTEGSYTLTAEINPDIGGKRVPESYYRNNKPLRLEFTVTGSPEPSRKGSGSGTVSAVTDAADRAGAVSGTWVPAADGTWEFYTDGKKTVSAWVKAVNPYAAGGPQAQWFRFDADGSMLTGWQWITDTDGVTRCYFLNPVSDGSLGACYLNGRTPDGWTVDANGAWTVNGAVQTG